MPLISPASTMFEHQTHGLTERPHTRRCASGNIKFGQTQSQILKIFKTL